MRRRNRSTFHPDHAARPDRSGPVPVSGSPEVAISTGLGLVMLAMACGGSGSSGGPATLSGTLAVADFEVLPGEILLYDGDLTIDASGTVHIDGDLLPSGSGSENLTIRAAGDVIIGGQVAAGSGDVGAPGGDLTIASAGGSIRVEPGASLVAGDGGAGQVEETDSEAGLLGGRTVTLRVLSGGGGGPGGSLTLEASAGSVSIPDEAGVLHVGNGGDASDIEVHGEDLFTTELPAQLENHGGSSGRLSIDAATILGIGVEAEVLESDLVDPATGETILPAGSTMETFRSDAFLSGGAGGRSGDLYHGLDAEGNDTWPDPPSGSDPSRLARIAPAFASGLGGAHPDRSQGRARDRETDQGGRRQLRRPPRPLHQRGPGRGGRAARPGLRRNRRQLSQAVARTGSAVVPGSRRRLGHRPGRARSPGRRPRWAGGRRWTSSGLRRRRRRRPRPTRCHGDGWSGRKRHREGWNRRRRRRRVPARSHGRRRGPRRRRRRCRSAGRSGVPGTGDHPAREGVGHRRKRRRRRRRNPGGWKRRDVAHGHGAPGSSGQPNRRGWREWWDPAAATTPWPPAPGRPAGGSSPTTES